MSAVDVLIVGAGPTGLALALELAAERVPFRIIDKASEASKLSRGLTLQVCHITYLVHVLKINAELATDA